MFPYRQLGRNEWGRNFFQCIKSHINFFAISYFRVCIAGTRVAKLLTRRKSHLQSFLCEIHFSQIGWTVRIRKSAVVVVLIVVFTDPLLTLDRKRRHGEHWVGIRWATFRSMPLILSSSFEQFQPENNPWTLSTAPQLLNWHRKVFFSTNTSLLKRSSQLEPQHCHFRRGQVVSVSKHTIRIRWPRRRSAKAAPPYSSHLVCF